VGIKLIIREIKMKKKKEVWIRECRKCGKEFNAFSKFSRVCDECKEKNLQKLRDRYYEKVIERRLKKRDGI